MVSYQTLQLSCLCSQKKSPSLGWLSLEVAELESLQLKVQLECHAGRGSLLTSHVMQRPTHTTHQVGSCTMEALQVLHKTSAER